MESFRAVVLASALLWLCGAATAVESVAIHDAQAGSAFSYHIAIEGGTPPFTFAPDAANPLPPGLQLDAKTGEVTGVPTKTQQKTFQFVISITDSSDPAQILSQSFTLNVKAAPMRVLADKPAMHILADPQVAKGTGLAQAAPANSSLPAPAAQDGNPPPAQNPSNPPSAQDAGGNSTTDFTITPDMSRRPVLKGEDVEFKISLAPKNNFSGMVSLTTMGLPAKAAGKFDKTSISGTDSASLTVSVSGDTAVDTYPFVVTGTSGSISHSIPLDLVVTPTGDLTRILVGLEQAGASSASSAAKFFFDFYNSRPLGAADAKTGEFGSPIRWWGDVRIGSTPIQTTAALSSITSAVTQAGRGLTLNQLAQAAEFQTGLEFRIKGSATGPLTPVYHDQEWTALGFILGGGATLPFDPRSSLSVFDLPASGEGRDRFNQQYAGYAATTSTQVAFTTPDRNQFFRQWFAGFRLTSLFEESDSNQQSYRSVGTVSFTIGQNETVSGGKLRGLVAQAEAFYPLPISIENQKLSAFYLFGRAAFQLTSSVQSDPLLLNLSSPQPTDLSNILVIARPSRRDIYTIGVGVDAIRFAKNLLSSSSSAKAAK